MQNIIKIVAAILLSSAVITINLDIGDVNLLIINYACCN